jgi:site-specific DNA recombinase
VNRPEPARVGGDGATTPTRVAIYLRISTDEEHQPLSLSAQDARLRAYIASQPGWILTGPVYRDERSGATTDRPGLQQALAAAAVGEYDILLVYRVDRLARSLRSLVAILDDLDLVGVGLRSASEPVDTTSPVGRMLVQMLGVFAQFEREVIIDRVIAGMERKAASGRWTGGTRPYGYQLDTGTDTLVPHPAEAAVLRQIFTRYAETRAGTRAIAAQLNDHGLPNRHGRPWSGQTIARILANRVYLGERIFRTVNTPGAHPGLVEPELFDRVQQILTARGEATTRHTGVGADYLLSGLITCGLCGSRYVGCSAHGHTRRYRYYACTRRTRYGRDPRHGCTGPRLPADHLEHQILDLLIATYGGSDIVDDALNLTTVHHGADADARQSELAAVTHQITATQTKIERYLAAFEAGTLTPQLCQQRVQSLTDQSARLRTRRNQLRRTIRTTPSPPDDTARETLRRRLADTIHSATRTEIRNWIEQLIADIRVIDQHHIQPYLRLDHP